MIPLDKCRRIEVFEKDRWVHTHMERLAVGDKIRIFEADGKLVKDHSKVQEWFVTSLPSFGADPASIA